MGLKTIEKLLNPAIEYVNNVSHMSTEEKIELIKRKYNLTHGKGNRKKKKKK